MSDQEMTFEPSPWIGSKKTGHDCLAILFSTLQESWGMQMYAHHPTMAEDELYRATAKMVECHNETLLEILAEGREADDGDIFDLCTNLENLDELLHDELLRRSKMLNVLSNFIASEYPSHEEWDKYAEALEYLSASHAALVKRLRFLREQLNNCGAPGTISEPVPLELEAA